MSISNISAQRSRGDKFLEHDIRHGAIQDFEDQCVKIIPSMNVTADVVAKVVSDATSFPVDKLKSTEQDKVLNLDIELGCGGENLNSHKTVSSSLTCAWRWSANRKP